MKDVYEDVDDFVSDVMPLEFRNLLHNKTKPEKRGSDSTAYNFEEKLEELLYGTNKEETAAQDEDKKDKA